MSDKRSFKIVSVNSNSHGLKTKDGGRYMAKTPVAAARKAFSRECNLSSISGVCALDVVIRETTHGSRKKHYKYHITRKLDPHTVNHNGKMVTHRFKTHAKSRKL